MAVQVRTAAPRVGAPVESAVAPIVEARSVRKTYDTGVVQVDALRGIDLAVAPGEMVAIMGPSGSGKSTLMHILGCLDTPDTGEVRINGRRVDGMRSAQLTKIRSAEIGFIFQGFNLIPTLSAKENILLPLTLAGEKPDQAWFDTIVQTVGMANRIDNLPSQLSGGQQQRVAVARALVPRPDIVFADEPTGALDSRTGIEILTFMRDAVDQSGQTIVMVTHDPVAASYADRVVFVGDGHITGEMIEPTTDQVIDHLKHWD